MAASSTLDHGEVFGPSGALIDSYSWTTDASTTYGRCPDGSGSFTTTGAATKGFANQCGGPAGLAPWPGGTQIQTADQANVLGGNMSGLVYDGSGSVSTSVLWAVRNGPGKMYRQVWNGSIWASDTSNGWGSGKTL